MSRDKRISVTAVSLALSLLGVILLAAATGVLAASPIATLESVEGFVLGEVQQRSSLLARIELLETHLFGKPSSGPLIPRIERIQAAALSGDSSGASLRLRLNAAEWVIYQRLTEGQALLKRLEAMETELYGNPNEGPLAARVESLVGLIWPGGKLITDTVELSKETVVNIEILDSFGSAKSQAGQTVRFRVSEDVIYPKNPNYITIPRGAVGTAVITKVERADRLGKDGQVVVDFQNIYALDGTPVKLAPGAKAVEGNRSVQTAVGASVAGMILLGPIVGPLGLAGAYFVKGADVDVPAGSRWVVELDRPVKLTALVLSLDSRESQK